jgi:hypothetical protein
VPAEQVEAMFTYDDDRRYLLRHDGYGLMVRGQAWRRGDSAIARLDEVIPGELHLPQLDAARAHDTARLGVARRWLLWGAAHLRPSSRKFDRYCAMIIAMLVVCVAISGLSIARGQARPLISTIVLTAVVVRLLIWLQDDTRHPRYKNATPRR